MWRPVPEERLLQEWLTASRTALDQSQWQAAHSAGAGITPAQAVEQVCALQSAKSLM
jgi:hypothetical protein